MKPVPLSPAELQRYQRQIGPGVLTQQGQEQLKGAAALVTRVGGMGGPAAQMLAMAGVGNLIIAHGGDMISPDLNRQVLGHEGVVGHPRSPHFADRLRAVNQFVQVEALDYQPDDEQAAELCARCDIVLACPPTFTERLRLNRAAARAGIPLIDAAQWGMTGSLMVLHAGKTACLECVYPQPPPFEEFFPVVGAISSAIGSLAALEAIKILSGNGRPLWGRLFLYDGFEGRTSSVRLARRPECPCCKDL